MPNLAKTMPGQQPESLNKVAFFPTFRYLTLILLGLLIFLAGFYTESIFSLLTEFYNHAFTVLGWKNAVTDTRKEVSDLVTMRSFPAMVTYGMLYTLLSFLFLFFYFRDKQQTRLAGIFYMAIFFCCALLIFIGKLSPELAGAYKLSRRLIEFIVSPFPIVLLVATSKAFSSFNK